MTDEADTAWPDDVRIALPINTFHAFHCDINLNFQLNRSLVPGEEGLFADLGRRIAGIADWKREFLTAGEQSEQKGNLGKAAQLYRAAEFFIAPQDPARHQTYDKFMDLFYRSDETAGFERCEVPYRAGRLHAVRLNAKGVGRGTVVLHGGFDSYIEEFLAIARAIASADFDVIMFDGPGQGTTLMRYGMTMTPQWHEPVGAVLDHFGLSDVTLIGLSLGGCLALRAAAMEPRITRVVAFDAMFDFFQCVTSANGRAIQLAITTLLAAGLNRLLNARVKAVMAKDFKARWGIEQGMHVTGTKVPSEFFGALREYTTKDVSPQVRQHTMILAGAADHFVPRDQFLRQVDSLKNATSVSAELFTAAENAQSHCQVGNQASAIIRIIRWIEGHSG